MQIPQFPPGPIAALSLALAGFVATGCAPASGFAQSEQTRNLGAQESASLLGSWQGTAPSQAPYGVDADLGGLGFTSDGRFFGRIATGVCTLETPVIGHIAGSYSVSPDGSLTLDTAFGALGALPPECTAALKSRFSGAFTVTNDGAKLTLVGRVDAYNTVRYQLARVGSYCTQDGDCAALGLAHDTCPGSFSCDTSANQCNYACTPVVEAGSVRIRVPSPIPADGMTQVPIFVDTTDPSLESVVLTLTLSRGDAGTLNATQVQIGQTGWEQGLQEGLAATAYFLPCDASTSVSCLGPATLSVTLAGGATVLAEAEIELTAPVEDLPATACLGGGDVIDTDFVTAVALDTVGAAHSTFDVGSFTGHAYCNADPVGSSCFLDLGYTGGGSFVDVTLSGPVLGPGTYPVIDSGDWEQVYGLSLGVTGDGLPAATSGRARVIEIAYVGSDPGSTPDLTQGAEVASATVVWELTAPGDQPFTLRGCAHYDSAVPAVNCGDGVLQAGEQCDDGNNVGGDGCSSTCQIEMP